MESQTHWNAIYAAKRDDELSWFEPEPKRSLDMIRAAAAPPARIVDVGAGTSPLTRHLLDAGYRVGALDISTTALERAKADLGRRAADVEWIVADVTEAADIGRFDLWHDRAVFHFLTKAPARRQYVELTKRTIPPGGHLIVATFGLNGPPRCSGLEVRRYDDSMLASEFNDGFRLMRATHETHCTPRRASQEFVYALFQRVI